MPFILISILVIFIGVIASIILFIVGLVRGLLKKGWRLVGYSVLLFIVVVIFYTIAQGLYIKYIQSAAVQNLQELSQPRPINLNK